MALDKRIVALHRKGLNEVDISCRLLIGIRSVQAALAKVGARLAEEITPEPLPAVALPPVEAPKEITPRKAPAAAAGAPVQATSSGQGAGSARSPRRTSPPARTSGPAAPATPQPRPSVTSLPVSSPSRSLPIVPSSGRDGLPTLAERSGKVESRRRVQTVAMPGDPIRGNVTPMPPRANGRTRNVAHRGWEDGPGFPACQWIEGDPRDRAFCGAPVLDRHDGRRSSYCPEHHARCWEPAKQMTRPTPDTVNPPGREGGQVHPKDAA